MDRSSHLDDDVGDESRAMTGTRATSARKAGGECAAAYRGGPTSRLRGPAVHAWASRTRVGQPYTWAANVAYADQRTRVDQAFPYTSRTSVAYDLRRVRGATSLARGPTYARGLACTRAPTFPPLDQHAAADGVVAADGVAARVPLDVTAVQTHMSGMQTSKRARDRATTWCACRSCA